MFIIGLMLIGFGMMIIAFQKFFALLAAMMFFIAGIGCAGTALKIFLAARRMRSSEDSSTVYHSNENVRIHELNDFDGTP